MTRREKVQYAILADISERPPEARGRTAAPLALDEYEAATVNAIAKEMIEIERLFSGDIREAADGSVQAVVPHELTERGKAYLELLRANA